MSEENKVDPKTVRFGGRLEGGKINKRHLHLEGLVVSARCPVCQGTIDSFFPPRERVEFDEPFTLVLKCRDCLSNHYKERGGPMVWPTARVRLVCRLEAVIEGEDILLPYFAQAAAAYTQEDLDEVYAAVCALVGIGSDLHRVFVARCITQFGALPPKGEAQ